MIGIPYDLIKRFPSIRFGRLGRVDEEHIINLMKETAWSHWSGCKQPPSRCVCTPWLALNLQSQTSQVLRGKLNNYIPDNMICSISKNNAVKNYTLPLIHYLYCGATLQVDQCNKYLIDNLLCRKGWFLMRLWHKITNSRRREWLPSQ